MLSAGWKRLPMHTGSRDGTVEACKQIRRQHAAGIHYARLEHVHGRRHSCRGLHLKDVKLMYGKDLQNAPASLTGLFCRQSA